MLVATIILVLGKNMYTIKPPQGNILTQVLGSIIVSIISHKVSGFLDIYLKRFYDYSIP